MGTEFSIEWLASGHFLFFALIIGVIVSIDVFVVEFTRDYEREGELKNKIWTPRMKKMAFMHAGFHAISFYLYTMVIYLAQFLIFFPIDFFNYDGVLYRSVLLS